jgi:hypothetical protein
MAHRVSGIYIYLHLNNLISIGTIKKFAMILLKHCASGLIVALMASASMWHML